jgi:chorismate dehydratase
VRRDYAAESPDLVAGVLGAFRRSLAHSVAHVDEIARAASRWEPFPTDVLASYFRTLRFEFRPRYRYGLREFARRAACHGLIPCVPRLEFFDCHASVAGLQRDGVSPGL